MPRPKGAALAAFTSQFSISFRGKPKKGVSLFPNSPFKSLQNPSFKGARLQGPMLPHSLFK